MTRVLLLVGTPKGAFILESDAGRQDWSVRGPLCEGWPIHDLIVEPEDRRHPRRGRIALVRPGRLAQRRSRRDLDPFVGGAGLSATTPRATVTTVWSLATTPDGAILAGVEPAGLFRSDDGGATWTHVEGLTNHPAARRGGRAPAA